VLKSPDRTPDPPSMSPLVDDLDRTRRTRQLVEALIAVAKETSADFIVIGLRRRTPVGKLILGSNAQRILLEAPCPVLAVKAEVD